MKVTLAQFTDLVNADLMGHRLELSGGLHLLAFLIEVKLGDGADTGAGIKRFLRRGQTLLAEDGR